MLYVVLRLTLGFCWVVFNTGIPWGLPYIYKHSLPEICYKMGDPAASGPQGSANSPEAKTTHKPQPSSHHTQTKPHKPKNVTHDIRVIGNLT